MQRSRGNTLTLVIMLLGMAALGFALPSLYGAIVERQATGAATLTPTLSPSDVAPEALNVLLVGVDALSPSPRKLESVSILVLQPNSTQAFLIGLSPETRVSAAETNAPRQTLGSVYASEAQSDQRAVITRYAIGRILPGLAASGAEVVFDRQALAQALQQVGPVVFRGETLDGQSLLRRFDDLQAGDALLRLKFQDDVMASLFASAQKQNWDWSRLLSTLGVRCYPSAEQVQALLAPFPALAGLQWSAIEAPLDPLATPMPLP